MLEKNIKLILGLKDRAVYFIHSSSPRRLERFVCSLNSNVRYTVASHESARAVYTDSHRQRARLGHHCPWSWAV